MLDGQHRLIAYMNLGLNLDNLVITEPLNVHMSIAVLIAEMNICTTTWKGTDYMAAPTMTLDNTNEVSNDAVDSHFGGDLKLYFRSIGTVLSGLLLVKVPRPQGYRDTQTEEFSAAVGEDKGKRG